MASDGNVANQETIDSLRAVEKGEDQPLLSSRSFQKLEKNSNVSCCAKSNHPVLSFSFGSLEKSQIAYLIAVLGFLTFLVWASMGGIEKCTYGQRVTLYNTVLLTLIFNFPQGTPVEKPKLAPEKITLLPEAKAEQPKPKPAAAPKVRLLYLDNVKNLLTFSIVVYHINCSMGANGWMPYTLNLGIFQDLKPAVTDSRPPNSDLPDPNATTGWVWGNVNWLARIMSWFNVVQQSYFMCLFFFISGYFTPSSLTRKGCFAFLQDKFKRFGIPLIIGAFIAYPFYTWSSMQMSFNFNSPENKTPFPVVPHRNIWYIPGEGPLWFVQFLLYLNLVFCIIFPNGMKDLPGAEEKLDEVLAEEEAYSLDIEKGSQWTSKRIPAPKFFDCIVVGTLFGLIQYFLIQNRFTIMNVPVGSEGGGLVFDILFFFAGAVAKKNLWLEEILAMTANNKTIPQSLLMARRRQRNRSQITLFRLHAILMVLVAGVFTLATPALFVSPEDRPGYFKTLGTPYIDTRHKRCVDWRNDVLTKYGNNYDVMNRFEPKLTPPAPKPAGNKPPPGMNSADNRSLLERIFTLQRSVDPADPTKYVVEDLNFNRNLVIPQFLDFDSLFWNLFRGQMTLTMTWMIIQLFSQHFNQDTSKEYPTYTWIFKTLASEAAYGVYLLHWLVYPFCMWLFLVATKPTGEKGDPLQFGICGDRVLGSTTRLSQGALWGCWIWTVILCNLILWPLTLGIRRYVPGADQVI